MQLDLQFFVEGMEAGDGGHYWQTTLQETYFNLSFQGC